MHATKPLFPFIYHTHTHTQHLSVHHHHRILHICEFIFKVLSANYLAVSLAVCFRQNDAQSCCSQNGIREQTHTLLFIFQKRHWILFVVYKAAPRYAAEMSAENNLLLYMLLLLLLKEENIVLRTRNIISVTGYFTQYF